MSINELFVVEMSVATFNALMSYSHTSGLVRGCSCTMKNLYSETRPHPWTGLKESVSVYVNGSQSQWALHFLKSEIFKIHDQSACHNM